MMHDHFIFLHAEFMSNFEKKFFLLLLLNAHLKKFINMNIKLSMC